MPGKPRLLNDNLRALPPLAPEANSPVVYVLPVEPGNGDGYWGDALKLIASLQDAFVRDTQLDAWYILPGFETAPWYADNPLDERVQYESRLRHEVVPIIEAELGVSTDPRDRLLLGFSKSGFGAVNLLLRNPDSFGCAASWDAPLMLRREDFGICHTEGQFGTPENYERYRPTRLARQQADLFQKRPRLAILGEATFGPNWLPDATGSHTAAFHNLLDELGVPHIFDLSLGAAHSWNADWVLPALYHLASLHHANRSHTDHA